jgi:hypothetical protein
LPFGLPLRDDNLIRQQLNASCEVWRMWGASNHAGVVMAKTMLT